MNVLLIDDSRAMRMILKRTLAEVRALRGATFSEAANGVEGLEAITAGDFDLVLCDWNMPEMDGITLLRTIRDQGENVTFGFVTSESTPVMYDTAMQAGASFLVTKPFQARNFELALERVG